MQTVKHLPRLVAAAAMGLVLLSGTPAQAAAQATQTTRAQVPASERPSWSRGTAAWKAGDHVGAGFHWSQTLAAIPENRRNAGVRMRLVLDTIDAYQRAYSTTGDAKHLHAGMDAYYGYFEAWETAYGHPGIPRSVIKARHALKEALDQEQSDSEGAATPVASPSSNPSSAEGGTHSGTNDPANGGQPEASSSTDQPPPPPDESGSTTTTNSSTSTRPAADPETSSSEGSSGSVATATSPDTDTTGTGTTTPPPAITVSASTSPTDRPSTPLIAAGAALIAVGAGAGSLIAVGAIQGGRIREDQRLPGYDDEQRDRIDAQGRTMNALMIAGLVATPVFVGGGAVLVAIGAKRRRASKLASVAPVVGRGMAGLVVRGRF